MCKLTKKQTEQLRMTLNHLKRGYGFLFHDDIVIGRVVQPGDCRAEDRITAVSGLTRIEIVNKDVGTDIAGLAFAVRHLVAFLDQHGFEDQRPQARVIVRESL